VITHAEILAKCGKLEIIRRRLVGVFLTKPTRALEGTEHAAVSRKEPALPLVPGLKKGTVERSVVIRKLRHVVAAAVRGEHGNACVKTEELGELPRHLARLICRSRPEATVIVVFAEAIAVGLPLVEVNLRFKRANRLKLVIDGNRGQLHDGVLLWVEAPRFDIKEDQSGRDVFHSRVWHSRRRYSNARRFRFGSLDFGAKVVR